MKIIAFPFAGGNRYSFTFLKRWLPKDFDLVVLEYPGRGLRHKEPLLTDLVPLLEDAFLRAAGEIGTEHYIIYGHSMGALIGYLICQRIERLKLQLPLKLVVSGRCAPSVKKKQERIHHLPAALFWEKVLAFGGVPEVLVKEPALMSFFEPVLKSDFKALDDYLYRKESPLSMPIDVFYGSEEIYSSSDMSRWSDETTGHVRLFRLKGDHFFIYKHGELLGDYFARLEGYKRYDNLIS
jgi:external thioesterase TEII